MESKMKIQLHLQNLREDCLKEYLQGRLETIASKEVIHDIIHGFLEANNEEFLSNIVDSIVQVKEQNHNLKDEIEQIHLYTEELKDTYDKMLQQKIKLIKQNQYKGSCLMKEMEKERQQFKANIQKMHQQYNKSINQLQKCDTEERQKCKLQKQVLASSLGKLTQKYDSLLLSHKKSSEERRLLQSNHQRYISSQEQIVRKIQLERIKQKESYQLQMQRRQKLATLKGQQYQIMKNDELKLADKFQADSARATWKTEQQNLKLQHDSLQFQYCRVCQKNQQLQMQVKQLNQKLKKLEQAVAGGQKRMQLDKVQLGYLREENNYLRQETQIFNNRYSLLQAEKAKLAKDNERLEDQISEVNSRILKESKQKQENLKLETQEFVQKNRRLQQETWRYNSQVELHKATIQHLQNQNNKLKQSLEETREQMQTFASYTSIHQQEITNYEREMAKMKEQYKANVIGDKANVGELASLKKENKRLNGIVKKKQDQIDLWKDKQSYYEIYMEQIAMLKHELQKFNPKQNTCLYSLNQSKFQKVNKKTRIYNKIRNIQLKIHTLREQNRECKQIFKAQRMTFTTFFNSAILLLVSKVKQQSLLCSYCQHQNLNKTTVLPPYEPQHFEETLPLRGNDFGFVKRNVRTIQQKYRMISQQSRNFSYHLDELIKR